MTSAGVRTIDGRTVPAVGTWAFEAGNSEIGFSVKHLVISRVRGAFREFEGEIRIAEDFAASVATARIAAASIDTGMAPRDNDLRGADFLDAQQHPYLEFRSTGVTVTDRQWQVTGDLTIAGRTRPVELRVEFAGVAADPWGNVKAVFSARTRFDREDFGLTYNKAIEGGGVLIGSTVDVEIELQAKQIA